MVSGAHTWEGGASTSVRRRVRHGGGPAWEGEGRKSETSGRVEAKDKDNPAPGSLGEVVHLRQDGAWWAAPGENPDAVQGREWGGPQSQCTQDYRRERVRRRID